MNATSFDRTALALATRKSRRQVAVGLSAAVAAIAGLGRSNLGTRADICGIDDSQDVEFYSGNLGVSREFVNAHQRPVGNLRWNSDLLERYADPGTVNARRWCSGTLITDDLFLTAGYCFENRPSGWAVPRIDDTDEPIPRTEVASNMHVNFNYQLGPDGDEREEKSFAVIELVEDRLLNLEYAIARLTGSPGLVFGTNAVAADDPPEGTMICLIGHPEGLPQRISAGPITGYEGTRIFYDDVDTAGGSGGSGILSVDTGAIVGIHTNGGCGNPGIGGNFGIRISALLEASPILVRLAT